MKLTVTARRMATILLCVCCVASAGLFAAEPDWPTILADIDRLSRFNDNDFSAEVTVVSQKPGEDDNTIVARYFRRDKAKQFTMVILKPEIQKGQGYFCIGDDLWFYDPESRKYAYSSLKDTFQGSDAQNSDFSTSNLAEDYTVSDYSSGTLGQAEVWIATLDARRNTVPVARTKLWIRKDNSLVLKEEHYSVSGRLMRTLAYPRYQMVSGSYVPQAILIVDNLKQGEKTQITFANVVISKLPDSVFHKEYLERVNR